MKLMSFRRRRLYKQTRRKGNITKNKRVFLWLGLSFLFIILCYFTVFKFLVVKEVEVKLDHAECTNAEEIKDWINLQGRSWMFLDTDFEKEGREKFVCINRIVLHKIFFNKIIVDVIGRYPVAVLKVTTLVESTNSASLEDILNEISSPSAQIASASGGLDKFNNSEKSFLVDDEGYVFSESDNNSVPSLHISGIDVKTRTYMEVNIIKSALRIFDKLKSFGVNIKWAKVYPINVLLVDTKPFMVFNLENRIDRQLGALQLILEKAKINEENVKFIDLRFDKPLVRYGEKERNKKTTQ